MTTRPTILVLDADAALLGLLREWLAELGEVTAGSAAAALPCDLVVVDLACPRRDEPGPLHRLGRSHPGTPVLALSPALFASVGCHGEVACSLGVAGVLPKPVKREALVAAVRRLLPRPQP